MKKEQCQGCGEMRHLETHDVINTETNNKVGSIDICLNCAYDMMDKGQLVIEE